MAAARMHGCDPPAPNATPSADKVSRKTLLIEDVVPSGAVDCEGGLCQRDLFMHHAPSGIPNGKSPSGEESPGRRIDCHYGVTRDLYFGLSGRGDATPTMTCETQRTRSRSAARGS